MRGCAIISLQHCKIGLFSITEKAAAVICLQLAVQPVNSPCGQKWQVHHSNEKAKKKIKKQIQNSLEAYAARAPCQELGLLVAAKICNHLDIQQCNT